MLLLSLALALTGCGRMTSAKGSHEAERLADRTIKALGGRRALDAPRFLAFDFVIQQGGRELLRRSHIWDRKTGRYRLEGIGRDGQPYVTLFNLKTREGFAYAGVNTAQKQMPPAANQAGALAEAYRDYQNDTAWLLGLFRLRENGVQLALVGPEVVQGRTYQVVAVTASGPAEGLLPGPQNWIHFDPEGGKPLAWSFVPTGQRDRAVYVLSGWQALDKVTVPVKFDRVGSPYSIVIDRLRPMGNIGENIFFTVSDPLLHYDPKLPPKSKIQERPR